MDKAVLNTLTERVIGCALAVHKALGPGLLESVYENALCIELAAQDIPHERQKVLPVAYRGESVGEFRLDLLVEEFLVVELKAVERHESVFEAQLLSYMKLGGYPIGLLINFNSRLLKDGIKRMRI